MATISYPNADNLEEWSTDELQVLGAPATQSNINAMMAWANTEGGWFHNSMEYNPLNTSRNTSAQGQTLGGTPQNSDGIMSFPTLDAGLEATAATIQQENMSGVLASLMGGKGSSTLQAGIDSSAWGGVGGAQDQIQSQLESGSIANPSALGASSYVTNSTPVAAELTSSTVTNNLPATTIASTPVGSVSVPGGLPTRIILVLFGVVLLLMGLHQMFSNNGPIDTAAAPVQAASGKAKKAAKGLALL